MPVQRKCAKKCCLDAERERERRRADTFAGVCESCVLGVREDIGVSLLLLSLFYSNLLLYYLILFSSSTTLSLPSPLHSAANTANTARRASPCSLYTRTPPIVSLF